MTTTDLPINDPWAGLNHKERMKAPERSKAFSRWVPTSERRRLTGYHVIDAYCSNNARTLLPPLDGDREREQAWQEYGDPALIVQRTADAVVGEDPTVSIVGADAPLAEGPEFPAEPPEPTQGRMSDQAFARRMAVYERQLEVWEAQLLDAVDRWEADVQRQPELIARQEWLQGWSDDEGFIRKLVETEKRNVVKHGSGVYALGWDEERARPSVEVYDPGSYFPVLDDTRPSEFPTRLHLAWEITEHKGDGTEEKFVRRITYDLVHRGSLPENFDEGDQPGYLDSPDDWTHVCLLSDGTWPLKAFEDTGLNNIEDGALWRTVFVDGEFVELRNYAIGYDFIPVVHVTHDLAGQTHYGTSPVAILAQLFDELQATDTDESMASRRAARPPMVIKGMAQRGGRTEEEKRLNNTVDASPGKAFITGESGGVDVLDVASALVALMDRTRRLLKRVSVNGSVTEGLIGRVDASEVPSGFALTLSFTSFEQMIHGARLAREASYRLLLKMVQRIQIHHAGGFDTFVTDDRGNAITNRSTEVLPAEIRFGAFMPQDLAGTIEIVARAVAAHTMSIETAIQMLQDAGVPVEDIRAELAAILRVWGELAVDYRNATDDVDAAADLLGLEPDDEPDDEPEPPVEPTGTDLTGVAGVGNGEA